MKAQFVLSMIVFFCWMLCSAIVEAQEKPGAIAPAQALKDGQWEEIDQRLIFLMVRLANVEASLDAVENAIARSTGKRSANLSAAKRAEQGNELMDRKGGGPMAWSEFYGRTAEKFFYHPTDKNTSYHTATVLRQNGPAADNKVGGGVPASQGLPVHQRPPQFDYIYRANQDAKAKAEREAAESKNKVEELIARRATLEAEQSALWCEVSFRAVSRYDLARKPIYRFEPVAVSVESNDRQRAEALKAAALFMRAALLIVAEAEKNQAQAFGNVKIIVADAREKLDDNWIRQAVLLSDMSDLKTPTGKFVVLAKRLDDVSKNLSDSYEVSIDGDRFKDEQRKDTFRALLQESLVSYAQIVLALDEMSVLMATEWKIKPDVDRPLMVPVMMTNVASSPNPRPAAVNDSRGSSSLPSSLNFVPLFDGTSLKGWKGETKHWSVQNGSIVGRMGPGNPKTSRNYLSTESTFRNFVLTARFKVSSGDAGILFRGKPNWLYALQVTVGVWKPVMFFDESPVERNDTVRRIVDDPSLASLVKQNQWNDIKIIAKGDHFECEINGRPAFNTTYSDGPRSGVVSLKVKKDTEVAFKDIKIARLPD